jgi:hypothetical protein
MAGLAVVPVGRVFQTVRSGRPLPEPAPLPDALVGEDDPRVPQDYLTRNLVGEFHYMKGATFERRDDVMFDNLGLIYRRNGLFEEALAAFRRSAQINPRAIASRSRAVAADKVAELEREVARARSLESNAQPAGLVPGTAAYHEALARSLAGEGHLLEARGHALRAQVAAAGR